MFGDSKKSVAVAHSVSKYCLSAKNADDYDQNFAGEWSEKVVGQTEVKVFNVHDYMFKNGKGVKLKDHLSSTDHRCPPSPLFLPFSNYSFSLNNIGEVGSVWSHCPFLTGWFGHRIIEAIYRLSWASMNGYLSAFHYTLFQSSS